MIDGMEVRRQQHYFSLDCFMYRIYTAGSDVWLKPDDPDDNADDDPTTGDDDNDGSSTLPPAFHPKMAKSGTQDAAHIDNNLGKETLNREIYRDITGDSHHN